MEINEKDIGLMEDYLDGKLSANEQKGFEKRLAEDKDFARAFALRKEMPAYFKDSREYEAVKKEVGQVIQKERSLLLGMNRYWALSIAATILVLIAVFISFQFYQQEDNKSQHLVENDEIEKLESDEPPNYAKKKTVADIEIVSPIDQERFKTNEKIRLEWRSYLAYQAEIIVTNPDFDKIFFRITVRLKDTYYDIPKNTLQPGTYKWALMDTTFTGSFIVEE